MASLCKSFKNLQLFSQHFTLSLNPIIAPVGIRTLQRNWCPPTPRKRLPSWLPERLEKPSEEYLSEENKKFIEEYKEKYIQPLSKSVVQNVPDVTWSANSRRCGLIGKKIGVYPLWLKNGKRVQSTLLEICDVQVLRYIPPKHYAPKISLKTRRKDIGCLVLGAENVDPQLLSNEYNKLFQEANVAPKLHVMRFNITPDAALIPGTRLYANHFQAGDVIDIRAKTIDRGFQGVMKRWGFHGMPATHGVTKTHRRPGNIGSGSSRARVVPGTKLPGHMGNRWRIHRGIRILRVNPKYNVIWVLGHNIPGEVNNYCYMYDTRLPHRKTQKAPFPTYFPGLEDIPESYADDVHRFSDDTITYKADS